MSHSHLPLKHLLKRLETRGPRPNRDIRPDWISRLIDDIAELFEPFTDVGRVGFDCRVVGDRWDVGMYLGKTELLGGAADGDLQCVSFQFDILRLYGLFDQVETFHWNAYPGTSDALESSWIAMTAAYQAHPVSVRILCVPPSEAGPGLRRRPDGSWDTV